MYYSTKNFKEDKYFPSKLFLILEKTTSTLQENSNENSLSKYERNCFSQNDSKSIRDFLTKELLDSINFSRLNETKKENDNQKTSIYSYNQNNLNNSLNLFLKQKEYSNNNNTQNSIFNTFIEKKSNKNKKYKKNFESREGDWNCYFCKNLNFSFRKKCNKCGVFKKYSESLHDKCMEDILSIINNNQKNRKRKSSFT